MSRSVADVAVLGSGFGGSLTALLLKRIGLNPVLIDRGGHPRFAIGESSTPVADYVLADLARDYTLPRIAPLAKYGSWQANYPDMICGIKRGFSYFHQVPAAPFQPRGDHANELLVAASADDAHSDTHWLRADVDAFLANEAQRAGVPLFDRTEVSLKQEGNGWLLSGMRLGDPVHVRARFLVDASGEAALVQRTLQVPSDAGRLTTHSRALFSHYSGVRPWREVLLSEGGSVEDHPFPCDQAALHHLLEEGWMWQLRFNNGITSAGFVVDSTEHALNESTTPEAEWDELLGRYPSIASQFKAARIVDPPGRLWRTKRLQRLAGRMVGENWAMLPHTAGFIDPLHSTGIAQTLCAVERLVQILKETWNGPSLHEALESYENSLRQEFMLVDQLVSGCYLARRGQRLFAAFSMLYFAAATTFEHRRHAGTLAKGAAFLCADDEAFRDIVQRQRRRLQFLLQAGEPSEEQIAEFERDLAAAVRPYNRVGLCDPAARNMYRYTAAPSE